jgi:hypothetical protein
MMDVGGGPNANTIFLDETWRRNKPQQFPVKLKIIRTNIIDKDRLQLFTMSNPLEEIYLLGGSHCSPDPASDSSTPPANGSRSDTVDGSPATPMTESNTLQSPRLDRYECVSIASDYLAAIQHHHGASLRCLLLPRSWLLDAQVIKKLVIACPNIEQLGLAVKDIHPEQLSIFFAHAPNIFAFRSLNIMSREAAERFTALEQHISALFIGKSLWRPEYKNLKYMEFGPHIIYQCGPVVQDPRGNGELARVVEKISIDAVKHINIWSMATQEVI